MHAIDEDGHVRRRRRAGAMSALPALGCTATGHRLPDVHRQHAVGHGDEARRRAARSATARPSRSTTPTPRAGSCSPTACRSPSRSSPTRSSTSPRSPVRAWSRSATTIAGVLGNDQALVDQVARRRRRPSTSRCGSCRSSKERYRKLLDSDVADMKNVGGPYGGRDHRGGLPLRVRRRRAVGAPRHRRPDERRRRRRLALQGRHRLRHPPARSTWPIDLRHARLTCRRRPRIVGQPDGGRRSAARPAGPGRRGARAAARPRPRSSPAASIASASGGPAPGRRAWHGVRVHSSWARLQLGRAGAAGGAATIGAGGGARRSRRCAGGRCRTSTQRCERLGERRRPCPW